MPTLPLGAQGVGVGLPATSTSSKSGPRIRGQQFIVPISVTHPSSRGQFWQTDPRAGQYSELAEGRDADGLGGFVMTDLLVGAGMAGKIPSCVYLSSVDKFLLPCWNRQPSLYAGTRLSALDGKSATWSSIGSVTDIVGSTVYAPGTTSFWLPLRTSQSDASTKLCLVTLPFSSRLQYAGIISGDIRINQVTSAGALGTSYTALSGDATINTGTLTDIYYDLDRKTLICRGLNTATTNNVYELFATSNNLTLNTGTASTYLTGLRGNSRYADITYRGAASGANPRSLEIPYSNWFGTAADYLWNKVLNVFCPESAFPLNNVGRYYATDHNQFSSFDVAFNECDGSGVGEVTYMRITPYTSTPATIGTRFSASSVDFYSYTTNTHESFLVEVFSDAARTVLIDQYVLRAPNPASMGFHQDTTAGKTVRVTNAVPVFIATKAKKVLWMYSQGGDVNTAINSNTTWAVANLGD